MILKMDIGVFFYGFVFHQPGDTYPFYLPTISPLEEDNHRLACLA